MDAIVSHRRRTVLLGIGALTLAGCSRAPDALSSTGYLQFGGSTMGSGYTVRLKAREQDGPAPARCGSGRARRGRRPHVDVQSGLGTVGIQPRVGRRCR